MLPVYLTESISYTLLLSYSSPKRHQCQLSNIKTLKSYRNTKNRNNNPHINTNIKLTIQPIAECYCDKPLLSL